MGSTVDMDNMTLPNSTEGTAASSEEEIWCSKNIPYPYENPCSGDVYKTVGVSVPVIVFVALILNSLSLVAFDRMNMNPAPLFLLKCLTVYDSLYLLGAFFTYSGNYLVWEMGIQHSVYLYVDRISWMVSQRVFAPMSYWTIAVLTVERSV